MTAYYWIGGTGFIHTSNPGTHFSLSSGGSPVSGTVTLTTADALFIDANSGPANFKIGVENAILGSLDCSAAPTGMVFYDSGSLFIYGNATMGANVTFASGMAFSGSADHSIQTNGCIIKHSIVNNGTGTLTLLDGLDLTNGGAWAAYGLVTNNGIVDTNGQSLSTGFLTVNNSEFIVTVDITMSGKLTGSGAAPKIRSSVSGTSHSISAGSISLANVEFQDITAAGPAIPWSGTNLVDGGGNTNINF